MTPSTAPHLQTIDRVRDELRAAGLFDEPLEERSTDPFTVLLDHWDDESCTCSEAGLCDEAVRLGQDAWTAYAMETVPA